MARAQSPTAPSANSSPSAPPTASAPASPVALETGVLATGARYTLALPAHWNRRLLILAPAQRPADRPLRAALEPDAFARQTFLREGWIVATTSYRRNGVIVADALADLDALHTHIVEKFGTTERVLLEGEGMGGLIVALLAERETSEPKAYHAALAIGATFELKEPGSTLGLTLQPKIPVVFLANQSEFEAARHYVDALTAFDQPALRPVLYRIARDGHANVNQRERLFGLRTLNLWLDHGRGTLPRPPPGTSYLDVSIPPEPQPSQVAFHTDHRGFEARVMAVSSDTGDFTVNAQPADFATIGLGKTARFQLVTDGQTHRATYVRGVERDLKRGEWLALANAEGYFVISRHRANAASSVNVSVGDSVTIRRFDSAGP